MKEYNFKISKKDAGARLDKFLQGHLSSNISRTYIKNLILNGNILVNNNISKPHHKLRADEEVAVKLLEQKVPLVEPQDIPLKIIFEDEDILVIDKPAGMVVHPASGNFSDTLVNALLFHCRSLSRINGPLRPGIVHRLDKDTSGLMLIAKNDDAHLDLAEQFKNRLIKRNYVGLVRGIIELDHGKIELPIGRDARHREKMAVIYASGRPATTEYRVLKRYKDFTVVELIPITGRTHQIRLHLAYIGHPLLGDLKYGKDKRLDRQALHSHYISFSHPRTKKIMEFESELPEDLKKLL